LAPLLKLVAENESDCACKEGFSHRAADGIGGVAVRERRARNRDAAGEVE
jgi:hypothetical protein